MNSQLFLLYFFSVLFFSTSLAFADADIVFQANPLVITAGDSATLSWSAPSGSLCTSYAESASTRGGWAWNVSDSWQSGARKATGTFQVRPIHNTRYNIACTAGSNKFSKMLEISVSERVAAKTTSTPALLIPLPNTESPSGHGISSSVSAPAATGPDPMPVAQKKQEVVPKKDLKTEIFTATTTPIVPSVVSVQAPLLQNEKNTAVKVLPPVYRAPAVFPQGKRAPSALYGTLALSPFNGSVWYLSAKGERYPLATNRDVSLLVKRFGAFAHRKELEKILVADWNIKGKDSDRDGLSDTIETALGTNKKKKDSDGDGYTDSVEVLHGYSPFNRGKAPIDERYTAVHAGNIISQKEGGFFWYVRPQDHKRYFLGAPSGALTRLKALAKKISKQDFEAFKMIGPPAVDKKPVVH